MLSDKTAVATIAVKDLNKAKKFYEETLGLIPVPGMDEGGMMYKSGNSMVFIYPSQFAGTNQATYAAWGVGEDIESVVDELKGKGIKFEHYENIPGAKLEGDIHVMGELKSAWFKDPDGNVLNILNKM